MRKVQRTRGLGRYHGGSFSPLDAMTTALLECPDYLDELPIYAEYGAPSPEDLMSVNEIRARLAQFPAQDVEQMMARRSRRDDESTLVYTTRIIELLEKENRRDERKAKRKEFWAKTLFGKKN